MAVAELDLIGLEQARLVMLQFNAPAFSGLQLPLRPAETAPASEQRRERQTGHCLYEEWETHHNLSFLPEGLAEAGYRLVDAWQQERRHDGKRTGKSYTTVHFAFDRDRAPGTYDEALCRITSDTSWGKVWVYNNPFYSEGVEESGQRAIMIECKARQSQCRSDCQIVVENDVLRIIAV
jgi:hypothetical protein